MELRFFSFVEFDCPMKPNSGYNYMDRELLSMLDEARRLSGIKFKIVEGFKSTERQKRQGGYPSNSHLIGRAVKIQCLNRKKRYKIITSLLEVGFTRIGVHTKYVYVDNDDQKADSIWIE
jgi:hypothetical protein